MFYMRRWPVRYVFPVQFDSSVAILAAILCVAACYCISDVSFHPTPFLYILCLEKSLNLAGINIHFDL